MNISINNSEIQEALIAYVGTLGIDLKNKTIEVSMVAGRGSNGYSANIGITKSDSGTPILQISETITDTINIEKAKEDAPIKKPIFGG
jgi:hypothetical protein